MMYAKGLLKKNLNSLKNRKWYHQRFDGCPYLIHMIAENELRNEKRKQKVGGVHTTRVCFFKNDRADWYLLMDDIEKTTKKMMEVAKTEPNVSKKLIKEWEKDNKEFYKKCQEILKLNLINLSNKELINLHDEYCDIAYKRFTSSSIIDGFALGTDVIIADMIENLLKEKGIESNYLDMFSKLTAPVTQSFINEAEISLLKIAKLYENKKDITKDLSVHIKKYYWSKNNYAEAKYLDEKHWMEEIKEIFEHNLDVDKQIHKIEDTPRRNKHLKMELMKILKMPRYIKTLITISEDFTWWQDERKKATYWNAEISVKLLKEISKRTKLTLDELKYMSVDEVKEILEYPLDKNIVKKRLGHCAFFWLNKDYECVTGKDVEFLRKTMFGDEKKKKVKEFTGLCASPGKVTGKVKVCRSSTEVGKMEKDEILVAIMTRPDYIIGMKKAKAIVTNEGGITCHAAIVSRELGIPCIIGTKIATEVLKDGDIVEVDANMGVVKIK